MRFLVNFHVMVNDKKITAIKDVRSATGMNLSDAKRFVETIIPGTLDSCGGELICNPSQVALLTCLDLNSRGTAAWGPNAGPTYAITAIRRLEEHQGIDISESIPY